MSILFTAINSNPVLAITIGLLIVTLILILRVFVGVGDFPSHEPNVGDE